MPEQIEHIAREDGCTCQHTWWDQSYHELHETGCPATLPPTQRTPKSDSVSSGLVTMASWLAGRRGISFEDCDSAEQAQWMWEADATMNQAGVPALLDVAEAAQTWKACKDHRREVIRLHADAVEGFDAHMDAIRLADAALNGAELGLADALGKISTATDDPSANPQKGSDDAS